MIELTRRTDMSDAAVLRQAPPFQGKPRFSAIVYHAIAEYQEIENAIFDLLDNLTPDTANAWMQTNLAPLVGLIASHPNTSYMEGLIKGQIAANSSDSTIEGIRKTAFALWQNSLTVRARSLGHDNVLVIGLGSLFDSVKLQILANSAEPQATVIVAYCNDFFEGTFLVYSATTPPSDVIAGTEVGRVGDIGLGGTLAYHQDTSNAAS